MQPTFFVIGGTGKTGRKVVERLTQAGHDVRIGSRNGTPPFDWQQPETWAPALKGVDRLYITFQPDLAVPGARQAIEGLMELAQSLGLEKVVLLSGKGEAEAQRCEAVVQQSGIAHTIVRASWFNQNFSESFLLEPLLAGHVALPQAHARVPYVDTNDIADVVVAALLDDRHNGAVYQLTGPATWTFEAVVAEVAKATNREIGFTAIPMEAYLGELKAIGLPADYVWLINYLFTEVLVAEGNNVVTDDIERVLGRPPRTLQEYVRETAASGAWDPAPSPAGV